MICTQRTYSIRSLRHSDVRAPVVAFLAIVALATCTTIPAAAIDGMLEASGSKQEGRTGSEAYRSTNQRLRASIGQRFDFSRNLWMFIRYGALQENQENRTAASFSSYRKENQDPYASLSFQKGEFEGGVFGNARRTDYFWSGLSSTRDDHLSGTAFAKFDGGGLKIEGRLTEGRARRFLDEGLVETRDHRVSLLTSARLSERDRLQYEFSRSANEVRTSDYEVRYRSHRLDYTGNRPFAGDRGSASLTARYNRLEQDVVFGGDENVDYIQPDWGGYVLDDTPEDLDPLEPDPIAIAALYDNDRDTPTVINIGDSAPVVREYGGDYRNIIFDFSDRVAITTAFLYVDVILRFPELMRWEVYVSDDPEGRDWGQPLGPDVVTWSYRQQPNGRQGWSFEFASPVEHRRLKVVNSKLGPTEPDIFITEFEVYGPAIGGTRDVSSRNDRYRLTGSVGFRLAQDLNADYRGDFWWATYGDNDRNDRNISHYAGLIWSPQTWRIAGNVSAGYRETSSGRNTEVYSQRVSVAQSPRRNLNWRTSWNRSNDVSYERNQVTNNVAGEISWRAFPALQLSQKIAYGLRNDYRLDLEASSWVLVTNLRTSPRRTITLDLRRSDRWVSEEAGAGFTTFNNTELRYSWALFPYLVYSGITRYQVRDQGYWVRRSILSLNPLPGGSMSMSFYASINEDDRAETRQRALGARATWRPRPRLLLEGGAELTRFTNGPSHSSPSNMNFRGYWTF